MNEVMQQIVADLLLNKDAAVCSFLKEYRDPQNGIYFLTSPPVLLKMYKNARKYLNNLIPLRQRRKNPILI